MRRLLLPLVAVLALAATPALASARTHVIVGMGDQHAQMFSQTRYRQLGIHHVRYFIRWDAIHHPKQLAWADAYVVAARAQHASVLMHISTNDLRNKKGRLPSLRQYRSNVGALIRHFRPMGVREWGAWNEVNHKSEETWNHPRAAAQFFVAMRSMCKGCTIVSLDVLDQAGVARYISSFYRALSPRNRRAASLVGIHDYEDTNRRRTSGLRTIIGAVHHYNRHAKFWSTETGGIVNFGRAWRCNTRRAANRLGYMFSLARRYRGTITRLYNYNYYGTNCRGFDSGLVNAKGASRPGYNTFRKDIRGFTR